MATPGGGHTESPITETCSSTPGPNVARSKKKARLDAHCRLMRRRSCPDGEKYAYEARARLKLRAGRSILSWRAGHDAIDSRHTCLAASIESDDDGSPLVRSTGSGISSSLLLAQSAKSGGGGGGALAPSASSSVGGVHLEAQPSFATGPLLGA
eukprot:scaffold57172_cov60-Phaeocystis_antarctica.AAC.1